jgi:hypothetical protein
LGENIESALTPSLPIGIFDRTGGILAMVSAMFTVYTNDYYDEKDNH